jgi:hypothetical protein
MRILLHIGTDKTGSSSIQRHLALNRDWFLAHSIYIPETGFRFGGGHARLLKDLGQDQLKSLAEELKAAAANGYDSALLSWEGMNFYTAAQIKRLSATLTPCPVTVLVYLREQAELLQSGHLQRVKKHSNTHAMYLFEEPGSWLEKLRSKTIRRHPNRNYYRMLRKWEKNIPDCDFNVRIFPGKSAEEYDVVVDFVRQTGLEIDQAFEKISVRQNPSLDVESAILIEAWQADAKPAEEIARLTDIACSIISRDGRGSKYFLSQSTVESVRAGFLSQNKLLARHFMGGESDPFHEPADCWRPLDMASMQRGAEALWRKISKIDEVPTLKQLVKGQDVARLTGHSDGWSAPANWGVWSLGPVSRIRLRVPHAWVSGGCQELRIVIRGKYYGENTETGVKINAIDFGNRRLDGGGSQFTLPVSELQPFEAVDITLTHTQAVSPQQFEGKDDLRQIAFGLETIGCVRTPARRAAAAPVAAV